LLSLVGEPVEPCRSMVAEPVEAWLLSLSKHGC
jgi:hypothetical protein